MDLEILLHHAERHCISYSPRFRSKTLAGMWATMDWGILDTTTARKEGDLLKNDHSLVVQVIHVTSCTSRSNGRAFSWNVDVKILNQFVVTSFLCHSLHPTSQCMRTAPALSSNEMDLGILLHYVGSTCLLGPIRTLRQNFGYTSTQRLFLMSKLSVNTTLMELRFRSLQHLETTSLGGLIQKLKSLRG